jgi:hypothetical protein
LPLRHYSASGVIVYAILGPTAPKPALGALFVGILGFAIAVVLMAEALVGERSEESEESDFSKEIEEET